jgi:hypothetical protein
MVEHDAQIPAADHPGRLDVDARLDQEHAGTHHAGVVRDVGDADGDHHVDQVRAKDGDDREREQDAGKCQ